MGVGTDNPYSPVSLWKRFRLPATCPSGKGIKMSRSWWFGVLGTGLVWLASFACMTWRTIGASRVLGEHGGSMVWGTWGLYLAALGAGLTSVLVVQRERLRAADIAAIAIDRAQARADLRYIGKR